MLAFEIFKHNAENKLSLYFTIVYFALYAFVHMEFKICTYENRIHLPIALLLQTEQIK